MNHKFLEGLKHPPTKAQMEVIMSPATLTVAIAGPGSGKTQTTAWRVQRIIEDGTPPHRIVVITFTNNAAAELEKRISRCPECGGQGYTVQPCMPDGEPEQVQCNCPPPVRLGYCGTLHGYILRLLMAHGGIIGFPPYLSILDEDESEAFLQQQLKAMNYQKLPKKELRAAIQKGPTKQGDALNLAVAGYYQKLQQTGTIDYDSMLVWGEKLVSELLKRDISLGAHLFVDEVQDSGDLDFAIYRKAPFANKTMVGDPDQSIYSFRGGQLRHLVNMVNVPGAKVVALESNFRSDVLICAAANRMIRHNKQRVEKQTLSVRGKDGELRVQASFSGGPVEAAWIAQDILRITDSVPERFREVAVLVRTNRLVDQLSLALQAAGIPVAKKVPPQFPMDWQHCRLFLSLLSNPENDYLAKKWLTAHKTDKVAEDQERFALTGLTSINANYLRLTIPALPDVPGLLRQNQLSEESIALVSTTLATLPDNSSVHDLSLALAQTWAMDETVGDGVTVSTIHGSKGREFDVVYLPAFEDQIIPGYRKNEDIEESRRLAYVAITRARHRLVITYCNKRIPAYGPRTPETVKPSRFIIEMLP